ncbi:hypothetical protein ElyMa_006054100 [Elysia marginata]|uniref:C2H2-type domain-containing protein n=1 Tax=Elysia marginata TaxID=1093978 RepID=A0AAV4GMK8_9GAST|nr:hypothetical protein ElyMa_006054100 [Elysia marginata]
MTTPPEKNATPTFIKSQQQGTKYNLLRVRRRLQPAPRAKCNSFYSHSQAIYISPTFCDDDTDDDKQDDSDDGDDDTDDDDDDDDDVDEEEDEEDDDEDNNDYDNNDGDGEKGEFLSSSSDRTNAGGAGCCCWRAVCDSCFAALSKRGHAAVNH